MNKKKNKGDWLNVHPEDRIHFRHYEYYFYHGMIFPIYC